MNNRVAHLQNILKEKSVDLFFIDDLINIYYLTGFELSAGSLLITQNQAVLIVDGRYYEACRKKSSIPVLLASAHPLPTLIEKYAQGMHVCGFDQETTTYARYLDLQKAMEPKLELRPYPNLVKQLRQIKEPEEIQHLRAAADLGCLGFDFVVEHLKEGITEAEVAEELELFWRKRGGKKTAFEPIIAFGANSAIPHHRAGKTALQRGMTVLIDIGVTLGKYHSDMTRTLFFGEPTEQMRKVYMTVQKAQQTALDLCRPGMRIGDLDQAAREVIAAEGFAEFFTHSLGHGIGLEVHESPLLRQTVPYKDQCLAAGMVITIEPGIYLPDIGGVRIEDTIVMTSSGYDNLTPRSKTFQLLD